MAGRVSCFAAMAILIVSLVLLQILSSTPQIRALKESWDENVAQYTHASKRRFLSKYVRGQSSSFSSSSPSTGVTIRPTLLVDVVNCSKLFVGDAAELSKADKFQEGYKKLVTPDGRFIKMAYNCTSFKSTRDYITSPVTEDERSFSIAFSILMFKHVEQTERLLRAIYRPQNYYCIHVDRKSPLDTYTAMRAIAACFHNVFVAKKRIDVVWGEYSVLEADLVCMEELLRYKTWRYFINLTGMEFPLKTNGDLVKILRAYNGANDVRGITPEYQEEKVIARTKKKLTTPTPYNITIVKGGVQVTLSRAFVEFMFGDKKALALREWLKDTDHPDESYMPSLSYNAHLHAPAAYLGDPNKLQPPSLNRYIVWDYKGTDPRCHGWRRHGVCVFGVRDLPTFVSRKELFLNKIMLDYQPLTYDCIEEWHFRKIRDEYAGRRDFNSTYYAQTAFAKYHRKL